MKLNLVTDIDHVKNKGDAICVGGTDSKTGEKITQLIMCCPGCGRRSGSAGNHKYNKETQTYRPSIVHDVKLGGCGWHGFLTEGEFKSC